MKKNTFYVLLVCIAAGLLTGITAFKTDDETKDVTTGYFFSWGIEKQNSDGNKLVISQPYYVNCSKNSSYVKLDLTDAFSKFYTKKYKSGYSYLSNPPSEGPFSTLEEAQSARTRKMKELGKDHLFLYIDDFRFTCGN